MKCKPFIRKIIEAPCRLDNIQDTLRGYKYSEMVINLWKRVMVIYLKHCESFLVKRLDNFFTFVTNSSSKMKASKSGKLVTLVNPTIISAKIRNKCSARSFHQLDLSSTGHSTQLFISSTHHFINYPFHQLSISSTGHFINWSIHQLVISSTGHFINWSINQLVISSTGRLINW